MKANFGILPLLSNGKKRNKRQRAVTYAERSLKKMNEFCYKHGL